MFTILSSSFPESATMSSSLSEKKPSCVSTGFSVGASSKKGEVASPSSVIASGISGIFGMLSISAISGVDGSISEVGASISGELLSSVFTEDMAILPSFRFARSALIDVISFFNPAKSDTICSRRLLSTVVVFVFCSCPFGDSVSSTFGAAWVTSSSVIAKS